jgi:glutathione-regulated potassium-efflux system ancillary protein KefC
LAIRVAQHHSVALRSFIYLGAAVLAVPLARAAGPGRHHRLPGRRHGHRALGPGAGERPEDILHFAEFGVVLMLFLVGLELEPRRLWAMRRPIFGWGSAQVLGCGRAAGRVAVAGRALAHGLVARAGAGAVVHRDRPGVLAERNLLRTRGQACFSCLLFQDVAAIPILALLPLLGAAAAGQARIRPFASGWARPRRWA